jgi:hypothetical protein
VEQLMGIILDIALGAAAFRLAWSVDKSQKAMVGIMDQQAAILKELTERVERLEKVIDEP